ncbi:MAG: 30S ribosomal protein S12 methylthiotransferase RimO [Eubacteriales bacterium]|nr:30S ribosomal protein S12 methylthiotransferase RimO [Eubacteriales bacterium]
MKILFISLGCDKNLIDSERMLGKLAGRGYEMTDDETDADIIIVNTCCFIDSAKEESINTILDMAQYKKDGKCQALIVTGCVAERYRQEVLDEIPEVDAIVGTNSYNKIEEAILAVGKGGRPSILEPLTGIPEGAKKRILTTGGFYEYIKIAEGCDKHCTYCAIPKMRGGFRSVPMEELIEEARDLAAQGVRELILVAQETTRYGVDLYGEKSLHILLQKLAEIEEIKWLRILYCYPEEIYPELIETIKTEPKVCHYLDLPIQHSADSILRRMGRRTSHDDLVSIISNLREEIPDIALRTTLITGFPGETEEEHNELMDFIDEMEFDRLGVFTYSQEEGTPAAEMPDQIDEDTKKRRQDELMTLQQDISCAKGEEMIGRTLEVFIEGFMSENNAYVGRTYADTPNVDGLIFIQTDEVLNSGDFVQAKVTGALEYDLVGELISVD